MPHPHSPGALEPWPGKSSARGLAADRQDNTPRLPGNGRSQSPDLHPLCLEWNCQRSEYLAVVFVSVATQPRRYSGCRWDRCDLCASCNHVDATEFLMNRQSAGGAVSDAARAADAYHCGRAGDVGRAALTRGHGSLRGRRRVQDRQPAQREQVKCGGECTPSGNFRRTRRPRSKAICGRSGQRQQANRDARVGMAGQAPWRS